MMQNDFSLSFTFLIHEMIYGCCISIASFFYFFIIPLSQDIALFKFCQRFRAKVWEKMTFQHFWNILNSWCKQRMTNWMPKHWRCTLNTIKARGRRRRKTMNVTYVLDLKQNYSVYGVELTFILLSKMKNKLKRLLFERIRFTCPFSFFRAHCAMHLAIKFASNQHHRLKCIQKQNTMFLFDCPWRRQPPEEMCTFHLFLFLLLTIVPCPVFFYLIRFCPHCDASTFFLFASFLFFSWRRQLHSIYTSLPFRKCSRPNVYSFT